MGPPSVSGTVGASRRCVARVKHFDFGSCRRESLGEFHDIDVEPTRIACPRLIEQKWTESMAMRCGNPTRGIVESVVSAAGT